MTLSPALAVLSAGRGLSMAMSKRAPICCNEEEARGFLGGISASRLKELRRQGLVRPLGNDWYSISSWSKQWTHLQKAAVSEIIRFT